MGSVIKKEIRSYFESPVAYVLIGLFFIVSSIIYSTGLLIGQIKYANTLTSMGVMLIFVTPVLTMRSFAEEHKNGTTRMLLGSPLGIGRIVVGKYIASVAVFLLMLILSLAYVIIAAVYGGEITSQVFSGYVGFFLLGCAFIAIGTFMSSITESQIQAAVFTIVVLIIVWAADQLSFQIGGTVASILSRIAFYNRFAFFTQGIFDLSSIFFFFSVTVLFLILTNVSLRLRRISK